MNSSPLYLVLDQGGHASRAMVFNAQGERLFSAETTITSFRNGVQVEHDANELVEGLVNVTHQVIKNVDLQKDNLLYAGLATQRSNMLCWRRSDISPLSPVISWQDRRANDKLEGIDLKKIHQKTGLFANAHYGASKMAWCLEHLTEVKQAARENDLLMGPMASYLASRLTGSLAQTDPANASRTLLWNIHSRDWDDELCQWFGIDKSWLPTCVESDSGFGYLSLSGNDIPLKIVTGDLSAAAFVNGKPDENIAYITLGTGGFIQRIINKLSAEQTLLNSVVHATAKKQFVSLEGTVNGSGSAISWLATQHKVKDSYIYEQLQQWCDSVDDPPLFLNAVSGIGSPAWCSHEKPYFNITASLAEQSVSVVESILFLLMQNIQTMNKVLPEPESIYISGGLSSTEAICQKLADLSQFPVRRSDEKEGTARGLAYLLSGKDEVWPYNYQIFKPENNQALLKRYQQWLNFMHEHTSEECLYFSSQVKE